MTGCGGATLLALAIGLGGMPPAPAAADAIAPDPGSVAGEVGDAGPRAEAEALTARGLARLEADGVTPDEGDLEQARADLRRAATLWQQLGETRQRGRCLFGISEASVQLDEYDAASSAAAAAKDIAEATGDRELLSLALGTLAMVHLEQDDPRIAEKMLRQAADLAAEAGLKSQRFTMLHNLASSFAVRHAYQDALDVHREALALAREAGFADKELTSLIAIASIHADLGDLDRAGRRLEQAVELAEASGDERRQAWALRELGEVRTEQQRYDQARAALERSYAIRRRLGNQRGAAIVINELATLERRLGNLDRALELYHEANAIADQLGDQRGVAVTRSNASRVLLDLGRAAEAHSDLAESLAAYRQLGLTHNQISILRSMAEASLAVGLPARARDEARTALGLLEEVRAELADPDLRAHYMAPRREIFVILAQALVQLAAADADAASDDLTEVFEAADQAHARTLLELVKGAAAGTGRSTDAASEQRRQQVLAELSATQRSLLESDLDDAQRSALEARRAALDDQRRELEAKRRRRWASAQEVTPDLAQVQRELGDGAALVEYLVGKRATVLVVVTDRSVKAQLLPGSDELAAQIGPLRKLLAHPGRRDRRRLQLATAQAGELLLGPALPLLRGRDRLIVIPDGVLELLPFEALRVGADHERVVDHWAVSYAPSATLLAGLEHHPRRPSAERSLFAVADPTLAGSEPPAAAPTDDADTPPTSRLLAAGHGLDDLAPLPGARAEVAAVARLFPDGRSEVLVGDAATEENVLADPMLTRATNLHFATHAVASEDLPEHSGLVLGSDGDGDGLLQAFEIFDLSLDADLVVLSGCETGLGPELAGEGVMGLPRAFLYAGADAVVISLWRVEDRATETLMTGFYRRLEHADPATALRGAKRELAATPGFEQPFYWAPFVLVGGLEPRTPGN